ncbi:MAG: SNF1-interacting protein [Geoglossum simile]|nr:MAG: SNF1-interacting protein [Geoglossum simile]
MGNTSTKEHRQPSSPSYPHPTGTSHDRYPVPPPSSSLPSPTSPVDRHAPPTHSSRPGRNRPDLSFLGLGGSSGGSTDRDPTTTEGRRETKVEREARRAERERMVRQKERERSMKEESVDGGYLVTQGVYTGTEDFNKAVVRQLTIERRLAPFFKGLDNHLDSWKDHQLVAAVRGLPIPAARDDSEIEDLARSTKLTSQYLTSLTVPIATRSRAHSYTSDSSSMPHPVFSPPSTTTPPLPPSSSQFRPRSKTIASLTTKNADADMTPLEVRLPDDPYVDGKPIEAVLYKEAIECPICFLYYPPYLNKTRCCDQPICSECFVQIKRPDPHPPEHGEPASLTGSGASSQAMEDGALVSEPAACPFCVQPEFGVTFEPPPFRRGLAYANQPPAHPLAGASSAMSSSSSLSSFPGSGSPMTPTSRRRTTSISAGASTVITTDRIRPDWAQKLANARNHAARRAAAATALHTAAYLMNTNANEGRGFGGFGRRGGLMRRSGPGNDSPGSPSGTGTPRGAEERIGFAALAAMTDRQGSSSRGDLGGFGAAFADGILGRPGSDLSARRRTRMMDLEDMMLMEAIRLSLAEEEERKKKEEKEEKKNAKKREKESKKAAKKGFNLSTGNESLSSAPPAIYGSGNGSSSTLGDAAYGDSKGKSVDRSGTRESGSVSSTLKYAATEETSSRIKLPPSPTGCASFTPHGVNDSGDYPIQPHHLHPSAQNTSQPFHPSHLRKMSNTSSSASSSIDSAAGSLRNGHHAFDGSPNTSGLSLGYGPATYDHADSFRSATPSSGGAGTEPMFNFRSLAAVIGDEEKEAEANHIERSIGARESTIGKAGESSDMKFPLPTEEHTMDDSTITLRALSSSTSIANAEGTRSKGAAASRPEMRLTTKEENRKVIGSVEVVTKPPSPATAG